MEAVGSFLSWMAYRSNALHYVQTMLKHLQIKRYLHNRIHCSLQSV